MILPLPVEQGHKNDLFSSTGGFKKALKEKTHERIFSADKNIGKQERRKGYIRRSNKANKDSIGQIFEEQGKISRIPNIADKPCNEKYRVLSSETKKNINERYYYDNNLSQW